MQVAPSRLPAPSALLGLIILLGLGGLPRLAQTAPPLDALAERFDHPERYKYLFERLQARGIARDRIQSAFATDKAQQRDERAVELRAEPARIPDHRADEREASARQVGRADIVADHLREHADLYDRMEADYGIAREVLAAILLKESALGRYDAFNHDAFVVFNSLFDMLAADTDRKRHLIQLAREQLIALVIYAHRRDLNLAQTPLPSSYAGAIGIPQFLPVHLSYAVTADSEGPPNLNKLPDAILSTANLIRNKLGWPEGPIDFDRLGDLEAMVANWRESAAYDDGFEPYQSDRPNLSYVKRYVAALKRYNPSSDYALGVLRIARQAHKHLPAKSE